MFPRACRRVILVALALGASTYNAAAATVYDHGAVPGRTAAAPSQALPHVAQGVQLLFNGGFEVNGGAGTNTFGSWTVVNLPGSVTGGIGTGDWFVQTGTVSPVNNFTVDAPTEGTFAAMTDQPGPGGHVLYQDIDVPVEGVQLACDVYILNSAQAYVNNGTLDWETTANQYARADLMDPAAAIDDLGTGVLENLFITAPGDPLEIGYQTITADLTPYAGSTVRLRFAEVDNQFFFSMGVDNCTTSQVPLQAIPTLGVAGLLGLGLLLSLAAVAYLVRRRRA